MKKNQLIQLIRNSNLFDDRFYLRQASGYLDTELTLIEHYLEYGAKLGLNPSENFDTSFYLQNNPDIIQSGINPLVHYLKTQNDKENIQQRSDSDNQCSQNHRKQADYKSSLVKLYKQTLQNFLCINQPLILPTQENPVISIILILFNRAELTFQCLRSLAENHHQSFEVIIVDNASSDETEKLLELVQGARIIRNSKNLHFLLASNQGAKMAKGEYLLFLNNDAQVLPGSINSALNTIKSSDDIGAVGGKIILLDGSLQEAGSIVWQDGSCLGYGRGESPFAPMYMFMRDVDYCSGAFLLTPKQLFAENGYFDEQFQPAYYEEVDYCFQLWQKGKRVVYDPNAVILHFEFASSNSNKKAIELQVKNRQKFIKKHYQQLQSYYPSAPQNILVARTANRNKPKVLFIDDRVPHPSLGAGFPRSNEILQSLLKVGCSVTFYPLNIPTEDWASVYSCDIPRTVEVMTEYGIQRLEEFLGTRQGYYDAILISRPHNMKITQPILRKHRDWFAQTKIIYDAEALFCLREIAKGKLRGKHYSQKKIDSLVEKEMNLCNGAICIISVSKAESQKFRDYGFSPVYTLGHTITAQPTDNTFAERLDILFIGAINNESEPNADALLWFVKKILPKIQRALGEKIKFIHVGVNKVEKIKKLANEQIKIVGRVDDLTDYYNQAHIFVAPTRFAAGIPIKVYTAAAHGVPVVTTSLIASQLNWQDGNEILVGDDPDTFAEKCVKLYQNVELWQNLRRNALKKVEQECSQTAFIKQVKEIINDIASMRNY